MKKFFLSLLTMFCASNLYASTCEVNLASNFDFRYDIENNKLNIQIEAKNKKDFIVYEYYNNINLFFNFIDKVKPVKKYNDDSGISYIVTADNQSDVSLGKLKDYFNDFSFALRARTQSTMYSYPLSEKEKKTFRKYIQTEDLKSMFIWLENYIPKEKKYGFQEVIFKIKLINDPEMKSCIVFQTKPIKVNFNGFVINDTIYKYNEVSKLIELLNSDYIFDQKRANDSLNLLFGKNKKFEIYDNTFYLNEEDEKSAEIKMLNEQKQTIKYWNELYHDGKLKK